MLILGKAEGFAIRWLTSYLRMDTEVRTERDRGSRFAECPPAGKLLGSIQNKGEKPMGKLKPHKGLLKRVKITAGKRVKFKRAGSSHLNSGHTGSQIRALRKKSTALSSDIPRLERMLHMRLEPSASRQGTPEARRQGK